MAKRMLTWIRVAWAGVAVAALVWGGAPADARSIGVLTGAAPGDAMGSSVAPAGDMNGDGIADVVVGAYQSDSRGPDAGTAYVFFGGRKFDIRPDLTMQGEAAGDLFGASVSGGGDVNRDGFSDIVVGANENDARGANAGRAYVFFGGRVPDAKPDVILNGEAAGDAFGYSVAMIGDMNGDGYGDVAVGSYENSVRGASAGRVYVFLGGQTMDSNPDLVLSGEAAGDYFGISVAGAGDVNRDGNADLIVGAYQNDAGGSGAGRAYVFFGGARLDDRPDLVLTGGASGDWFGFSVASAGDTNKDGFSDVLVGAYHNDAGGADAGRAYVFYGGASPDADPDWTVTGAAAGDAFGYSVASAGDANGDGYSDIVVGAFGNDAGGSAAGRVYIYCGGAAPDVASDYTATGEAALENLGYVVAGVGDVDQDGFPDVAGSAPFADYGRTSIYAPAARIRSLAGR